MIPWKVDKARKLENELVDLCHVVENHHYYVCRNLRDFSDEELFEEQKYKSFLEDELRNSKYNYDLCFWFSFRDVLEYNLGRDSLYQTFLVLISETTKRAREYDKEGEEWKEE